MAAPRAVPLEDRLKRLSADQRQTLAAAKNAHERGRYHHDERQKQFDRCKLLLWKLRQQGVSIRTLGEALGLSPTRITALTRSFRR